MNETTLKEWDNFVRSLKELRSERGLSVEEMAAYLDIGVRTLTEIEEGRLPEKLSTKIVYSIYERFGISPREMFTSPDVQR